MSLGKIERSVQIAVIDHAKMLANVNPEWDLLCAYPLQRGNDFLWLKMRMEEGAIKGWPDLFLPVAKGGYNGLFIELKSKKGKLSEDQEKVLKKLTARGYKCVVMYVNEASPVIALIQKYLREELPKPVKTA